MPNLFGVLVAAFNVQQMLASGVIGGGAALAIAAVAQMFKKPKPPEEGQEEAKKLNPTIGVLLIIVGLALVVVGVIWRVNSQQNR